MGHLPNKHQMNATGKKLPREEWDFEDRNKLPDDQLHACFLHEFGREYVNESPRLARMLSDYRRLENLPKRDKRRREGRKRFKEIFELLGTSNPSFVYDLDFPRTPWQSLSRSIRDEISKHLNQFEHSFIKSFLESISVRVTLLRDLPEWAEAGVKDFDTWSLVDSCYFREGQRREYGFFAIDWSFPDTQIKAIFAQWLKEKRGDKRASESQRGVIKERQNLNALGAKRLLEAGFTAEQAINYTQKFLKDCQGHPCPLYDAPRTWYEAKNQMVPTILRRLFSFSAPSPSRTR